MDVFRDFWWLVFPLFGMVMASLGVLREGGRIDAIHERARRELGSK